MLYLDLEGLKQSKSNREEKYKNIKKGEWAGGRGGRGRRILKKRMTHSEAGKTCEENNGQLTETQTVVGGES